MSSHEKLYYAKVVRIITKAVSLASMPPLTESELADRAQDWMGLMFTVVPEGRLEQAFRSAVHAHSGPFPVTAYEVLDGFKQIAAAPGYSAPVSDPKPKDGSYCLRCHNTGYEHVYSLSGELLGVRAGQVTCDHREVMQGEGLWYALENARREREERRGLRAV